MYFTTLINNQKKLSKKTVFFGSLLFLCLNCTSNTDKTVLQTENKALSNTELNLLTLVSNLDTNNVEDIELITDSWIHTKERELHLQEINSEALAQAKKQLLDFEQSIYTMYLENQFIKAQLEMLVKDEEILLFYNKNREQYAQKTLL